MSPEAAKKWERSKIDASEEEVLTNREVVSRNLKIMRRAFKVTQADVAERIGCSLQSYCGWEQGRTIPSMEWLTRLAKVFGVDVAYFFTKPGPPPKPAKKTRKKTGH